MKEDKISGQTPLTQSERGQIRNEQVFRRANEKVQKELKILERMAKADGDTTVIPAKDMTLKFYCECSNENCRERIKMTLHKYEELHKDRSHFIVLPGHETIEVEKVISEKNDYSLVDKFVTLSEQSI